jgi:hypothetical protein
MALHGLHILPVIGVLSGVSTAVTFLYGVYKQIRRAVTAIVEAKDSFVRMVDEHHDMYGWYSAHVKPKHEKSNGLAV